MASVDAKLNSCLASFTHTYTHTHTHTSERELSLQHGTCCCGRCNLHLLAIVADFDILSHYVRQFRCLSRAFSPDSIWRKCKQRKFAHFLQSKKNQKKRKFYNFSTTSVRGSFVRELNVAAFSIYQIQIVPQNCHREREGERERGAGSGLS